MPRRYARCDELVRFGAVPHTSAGAEPSRGARRNYYQGAALHLASCPVTDGPLGLPRINARRVGRVTRSEPPDTSSIATERDSRNPSAPSTTELTSPPVPPSDSRSMPGTQGLAPSCCAQITQFCLPCPSMPVVETARRGGAPVRGCGALQHGARRRGARARATAPRPAAP